MKIEYFDSFRGPNQYDFLSNFYASPIEILGISYPTGEHAFAAYKAQDLATHITIAGASNPSLAKKWGRQIPLRTDWESVKYDVMVAVLRAKFSVGSPLANKLLSTGHALLVEGTDWNDRVWGIDNQTGRGRNWLGTLLMARRAELESGEKETEDNTRLLLIARPYFKKTK